MGDTPRVEIDSILRGLRLRRHGSKLATIYLATLVLLTASFSSTELHAQSPAHIWISTSNTNPVGPPQSGAQVPTVDVANGNSRDLYIWAQPSAGKWLNSFSLNLLSSDPSVASFAASSVVVYNAVAGSPNRFALTVDSTPNVNGSKVEVDAAFNMTRLRLIKGLNYNGLPGYGSTKGVGGATCGTDTTNCKMIGPVNDLKPAWLLAKLTVNSIANEGTTAFYLQLGDSGILQATYNQSTDTYTTDTTLNSSVVFGAVDGPAHNGANDTEADAPVPLIKGINEDTPDFFLRAGGLSPGDFNSDGKVDGADYVAWRNGLGSTYNQSHYMTWRSHFGQTSGAGTGQSAVLAIPEPATAAYLAICLLLIAVFNRSASARSVPSWNGTYRSKFSQVCQVDGLTVYSGFAFANLRLVAISLTAIAIIGCLSMRASAIDVYWSNPAGGSFSTGANWTGGLPPGNLDHPLFTLPNAYTVTFPADATTAGQHTTAGQVSLNLQNHVYDVNGYSEISNSGTQLHVIGDYKQSSNTLSVVSGGQLLVDGKLNFSGHSMLVHAGGSLSIGNPQQSSIITNGIYVSGGAQVNVGLINSASDVVVNSAGGVGGKLRSYGDMTQTGGRFITDFDATTQVDGKFNFTGSLFHVAINSNVVVGNTAQSLIQTTGDFNVIANSQATIGSIAAGSNILLSNNSVVNAAGDVTQSSGNFTVELNSPFSVGGKLNLTGQSFRVATGGRLTVGNPTQSSIKMTGTIGVFDAAQVAVNTINAGSDVWVSNPGSKLQTLGDYTQTGGYFKADNNSQFQSSGKFNFSGTSFTAGGGASFNVGIPAQSSITSTSGIYVTNGTQVNVGSINAASDVIVNSVNAVGGKLRSYGDMMQTGGQFITDFGGTTQVDGKLNFTGSLFHVAINSNVVVGTTAQSLIQTTGDFNVISNSQASVGSITAGSDILVSNSSVVNAAGDVSQTGGNFTVELNSPFQVGGRLNLTGESFRVATGGTLSVGNPAQSSINMTGTIDVFDGAQVTVSTVNAGSDVSLSSTGTKLRTLTDYTQTGGTLRVVSGGQLEVDGKLNFDGHSMLVYAGGTLNIGSPQQSSIITDGIYVSSGAQVNVGLINSASDVVVNSAGGVGGKLRSYGDMTQTGGQFITDFGATTQVDGKFNFTGSLFHVAIDSNVVVGNTAQSLIQTTGDFNVIANSQATVGSISAGSNILLSNLGMVHAAGDVTQSGGKFTVEINSQFQVGGTLSTANSSIRISNGGSVASNSALYWNTSRSAIEGNIFAGSSWNTATNLRIEGANHISGTTTLNAWDTGILSVGNTLTIGANGKLSGNATIVSPQFVVEKDGQISGGLTLQGSVLNAGQVGPGLTAGILNVTGTYMQQSDGALQIEVGGTSVGSTYDKLQVTGTANISGRLDVPLINGFVPQAGNEISYLQAASISGGFESLSSPNLVTSGNGLGIELSNTSTDLKLKFVAVSSKNFEGTAANSNWADSSNWSLGTAPKSSSIVTLQNNTAGAQQVAVTQNTFVHGLTVSGGANPLTLAIQSGKSFSSLTGVTISNQGVVDIDSGRLVTHTLNVSTGGQLKVQNGGRFLTSSNSITPVTISAVPGPGTASVLVTGAGSEFRTDGILAIGNTGNGSLAVQDQGAVRSIGGQIGISTGSNGSVSLSGSNSKWTVGESLYIGGTSVAAGGTGQITLTDNARLAVGDRLHLWQSGSLSIDSTSIASVGVGTPTNTPGSLQILPGGVFSGRGTISGKVINSGRLQPGASPGITVISGDYTQTADGALEIEVGGLTPGTQHDQVQVSGLASLDGAIEFPIVGGFVPQIGMAPITFMTAGSISGEPKTLVSPNLKTVSPNVGFRVVKSLDQKKLELFFVQPTDVNFVDAAATETAPADWAQSGSWSAGNVPRTDTRITVGNNSSTLEPQRIDVKSLDPISGQPVAYADQLDVTDQLGQITVGVNTGYRLQASTGSVVISKNGAIELAPGGVLATPQAVQLTSGGTLRGDGTVVADDLIVTDGTVSPGITVGNLAVEGNYRLGAKSKLMIDVSGKVDAQHDMVNVAGELELGGEVTFTLSPTSTIVAGDTFPVLTAQDISTSKRFKTVRTLGSDDLYIAIKYPSANLGSGSEVGDPGVVEAVAGRQGDLNFDGRILKQDLTEGGKTYKSDIPYFALALSDLKRYEESPMPNGGGLLGQTWLAGDFGSPSDSEGVYKRDGLLTLDDIKGFANKLNMPAAALMAALQGVPEPSSVVLAATSIAALLGRYRRRAFGIMNR